MVVKTTPPHTPSSAAVATSAPASVLRPEFFPLPAKGGDPVCGLSRSFWLDSEARGMIRLVRLNKPGRIRGRVLVPTADAIAFVHKLGAASV